MGHYGTKGGERNPLTQIEYNIFILYYESRIS